MAHLVLINGTKRTGKTTIANMLADRIRNSIRINFADHLKTMTHAVYGLPSDPDYFESVKDLALPEFGGVSPRDSYIHMSENVIKPRHGSQFFGAIYLRKCGELMRKYGYAEDDVTFISGDTGFPSETIPPLMHYGTENAILIRMRRRGAPAEGDSRGYFSPQDIVNSSVRYNNDYHKIEFPYVPKSDMSALPPLFDADIVNVDGLPGVATGKIMEIHNMLFGGAEVRYGLAAAAAGQSGLQAVPRRDDEAPTAIKYTP